MTWIPFAAFTLFPPNEKLSLSDVLSRSKVIVAHLLIGHLKMAYGAAKIPSTAQLPRSRRLHTIVLDTHFPHLKAGVYDLQAVQHF
jgi:hypothetical protein